MFPLVKVFRKHMKTEGVLLGRDEGGSGTQREKRQNRAAGSWSKGDIHMDEDGEMKVTSLGNMQHG